MASVAAMLYGAGVAYRLVRHVARHIARLGCCRLQSAAASTFVDRILLGGNVQKMDLEALLTLTTAILLRDQKLSTDKQMRRHEIEGVVEKAMDIHSAAKTALAGQDAMAAQIAARQKR
jgi:hypothetical protein